MNQFSLRRPGMTLATCGCCLLYMVVPVVVLLAPWLWPLLVPFSLLHFWFWSGTLPEIALDALPLFLAGGSATLLLIFVARRRIFAYLEDYSATWLPANLLNALPLVEWNVRTPYVARSGAYLVRNAFWLIVNGLFRSLMHTIFGLWIFFYGYCVLLSLVNALSSGALQWLYVNALRPVGDLLTLYLLHPYLYGDSWVIGAGIISIPLFRLNFRSFRDMPFWFLLIWLPNMLLFLLILQHGLWPTLLVYTLYHLLILLLIPRLLKRPEEGQEEEVGEEG